MCPILAEAEEVMKSHKSLTKEKIFGLSTHAIFVGAWNYPKVLAGPLIPPFSVEDSSIIDLTEF